MDWQQAVSLTIVALAAIAFLWAKFRPRKFSLKHGSPCGCGSAHTPKSQGSITFRAHKGGRPEIIVKMK